MPRIRRDHDETSTTEPHTGIQGEGGVRREPAAKYYKECIRAGVPTSRQEKAQKIGAFSAYAETAISSAWS